MASKRLVVVSALAGALPAQVGWVPVRQFSPEAQFVAFTDPAQLVTDRARGRLVSFSAFRDYGLPSTTWEWGGSSWTERHAPGPVTRKNAAFAYDELRRRCVLFGGDDGNSLLGDTWEWDGTSWTAVTTLHAPSPRNGAAAAFHPGLGKVVMHGGRAGAAYAETWLYDGVDWNLLSTPTAPPALWLHRLALDRVRGEIVLAGGGPAFGANNTQTWTFDGVDWDLAATGSPSGLDPALVFDEVGGVTLFFGGASGYAPSTVSAWNGSSWQVVGTTPFAGPPLLPAANDPADGSAIVFAEGMVWRWTGSGFVAIAAASSAPPDDKGVLAVSDTVRGRLVVAGHGTWPSQRLTWEWDGATWQRLAVATPALGELAAAAFDPIGGRVVVHGGVSSVGSYLDSASTFDGVSWSALPATAVKPAARARHAIAYDEARQRLVLFGGFMTFICSPAICPVIFSDTWLHDGLTWTQVGGSGPGPRTGHAMCYDPVRQTVVMFGGTDGVATLGDTWQWNGTVWAQLAPPLSPPARMDARMAFAPLRGTVVLHGGASTTTVYDDLWEFDGVTWTQIPAGTTAPRALPGLAIDPPTQRLMLFGGKVPGSSTATIARLDAWLLDLLAAPQTQSLGPGCAGGGAAVPTLSSDSPYVDHAAFRFELRDLSPSSLAVFGVSFVPQVTTVGPCAIYVANADVLFAALANPAGVATLPVPLPSVPALLGQSLAAQGAALASPGAVLGLDFSNGWQVTFGN